jgi:radical SAM protein with 4Fe4S-binding SPASM domain
LRKDFFKILKYAKNKGFILGILGNPYHLDLTTAKKLKNLRVSFYQISIDGLEKTHDKLRRKGSFRESLRALRLLKRVGIKTKVMFTLSKYNMNELIKVMRLVARENVDMFSFSRLVPIGSGEKLKKDLPTPEEYRKLLLEILEEIAKLKAKGFKTQFKIRESLFSLLLQELGLLPPLPNNGIIYSGCGIGINSLAILADGTVYPCRRLPIKIGKVPEQKIKDIFLHSKILNELRNVEKFKKCSKCDLLQVCRGCPAIAYAVHGDYFAPDPQCWKKI